MDDLRDGSLDTQAAAIAIDSHGVRQIFCMTCDAQVIICLAETAAACDQFALVIPLQASAGNDIEHPVGTVTLVRLVAASLYLAVVNILGIHGGAQIACNVGVRNFHPVHCPGGLVASAYVQLIMYHIGAR